MMKRKFIITTQMWCVAALLLVFLRSVSTLVSPLVVASQHYPQQKPVLAVDWAGAKAALRSPDCCVVSISGLDSHLRALQAQWSDAPSDIDIRARVRVRSSAHDDCLRIRNSVSPSAETRNNNDDTCAAALEELARGVASLADGPLEGVCEDVFVRIVCASNYRALDPSYHTDKAPLRGYVTLRGVGTEFMTRPSTPMEYVTLRSLGKGEPAKSVRRAQELEFIVMKGDHYEAPLSSSSSSNWMDKVWKRTSACVHRSPPGAMTGSGRRVIVSLDLADGDDDREWYTVNKKREWSSGMTQRKSRLVA